MRSRTPLICFFSKEAMERSTSLCGIFTRPVVLLLPGSLIPLLSAKEMPLNFSLPAHEMLAWREGQAQVVKELSTAWAGQWFSLRAPSHELSNPLLSESGRGQKLFNTECRDTTSNVKMFSFTNNLSSIVLDNSTVTQLVLFWNVMQ